MIQLAVPAYLLGGLLKAVEKLIKILTKTRKSITSVTKYRGGVPQRGQTSYYDKELGERFVTPDELFYAGAEMPSFGERGHNYDLSYAARDAGNYDLKYSPLIIVDEDIGGSRASFLRKADIVKKVYDEASRYFSSDTRKMAIEKNKVRALSIYGKDDPFLKYAKFDAVNQLAYPTRISLIYNVPFSDLAFLNDSESLGGVTLTPDKVGDLNRIYLYSGYSDEGLEGILWHELMHAGSLGRRLPAGSTIRDEADAFHEDVVKAATKEFYKRLVGEILVPQDQALKRGLTLERVDYIYRPQETAAYAMEIGRKLGLKPGEKYIDDKSTIDLINRAKWAYGHDPRDVHVLLLNLIEDTPEARKNWFEAMTGLLFTIGALIGASKLVNYINNDGGK